MSSKSASSLSWWIRLAAMATVGTSSLVLLGSVLLLRSPDLRAAVGTERGGGKAGYLVGDIVDVPSEFFSDAQFTVLIFANSTCGACQANAPLYARLTAELKDPSSRVRLVGLQSDRGLGDYASRTGVVAERVTALSEPALDALKLRAVPTVLLVNRKGTILLESVGRKETVEGEQFLEALRTRVATAHQ